MARTNIEQFNATPLPQVQVRPTRKSGPPGAHKQVVKSLPAETNRQRFLRIGQYRIVNALKALRLVGNLAGQGYEYTADDIGLMRNTIGDAVEEAFARFEKSHDHIKKLEQTFKLAELVQH